MKKITIYPSYFKQFGDAEGSTFYLVTNSSLLDVFLIEDDKKYKNFKVIVYDSDVSFIELLSKEIQEPAHILVIAPECLFESVHPNDLGPRRKLLIFACNSAPTSLEAIEHFLRCGEKTDPEEQEKVADRFFTQCESTHLLKLIDEEYQTVAEFLHLNEFYGWHEQLGVLEWGGQQIFPSGEIACFLVPLKGINKLPDIQFYLNGEIALRGYPVVHSGPPSFLREDQERIYQKLATFKDYPVIIKIEDGIVVDIKATHQSAKSALKMLEAMFMVDSRFRQIFEIGFAINRHVEIFPRNSAMNEVYGGEEGCVHFGFGMLPYTQYHLDLICPNIKVLNKDNEVIFGSNKKRDESKETKKIIRHRVSHCPCLG
ncbi:hypothetical protein NIES4074_65120 (plasmid) [Cylindrospermum sp. NIES-4074]|nr:hypothetical protein NIES4074_65120 [Cylindrospermum sp. NIES-4074]